MANNIVINVTAADQTQRGLGAARDSISSFGGSMAGVLGAAGGVAAGVFAVGFSEALDLSSAQISLENQLGLEGEAAERAGNIAGKVFSKGFGGSIDDVNTSLAGIHTGIGDLGSFTENQLEGMSKSALALSKTFGVDVAESTSAVGQLIKTGLVKDADEGFDLIAKTMQGIPASLRDDVLPTIQEYGTQFRKVGLDGATAMGLISQGLRAGARDADLVADAVKEFSIRSIDGSKSTIEGFTAIGLNAEDMAAKIAKGGKDGAEGLSQTLEALRNIEDPVKRSTAATALFGTQAEDLGDALFALDPSTAAAASGLDDAAGAAARMAKKLETSPAQQLDAAMRQLKTTLGEAFLPILQATASILTNHVMPALESFRTTVGEALSSFKADFASAAEGSSISMEQIRTFINDTMEQIKTVIVEGTALIKEIWDKWGDDIVEAIEIAWKALKPIVTSSLSVIQGVITLVTGLISGNWGKVWDGIKMILSGVWERMRAIVGGAVGLLKKILEIGMSLIFRLMKSAWEGIKNTASGAINKLIDFVRGIPGRAKKALGNIGSLLRQAGKDLIRGMINGVKDMAGALARSAKDTVSGAIKGAKSILGISSPSKVFLEIGKNTGQGMINGLNGISPKVGEAAKVMMQKDVIGSSSPRGSSTAPLVNLPALRSLPSGAAGSPLGQRNAGNMTITLMIGDRALGDIIIDPLRNAVRTRGGNVQAVLGRG